VRLEARDLHVVLGGRAVLTGADLAVTANETVVVLGPSGSGKTTLLRVIAGLQRPDHGSVLLDGIDVTEMPPNRRGIGLVFQDRALFPHRDVAGNVAFGLRMAKLPHREIARRVPELLELVGLAGMGARDVATLSGGEQQRVALARALAPRPRVLLLDEPLGGLDRPLRDRLLDELGALFDRLELTVVLVTHDVAEAFAVADRVAVVRDGRIVQAASPDELWARPADAWTARFLGLANVEADGETARVTRPEAVRLTPSADGNAVVTRVERRGPLVRVAVRLDSGGTLEAATAGVEHPAVGQRVTVVVDESGVTRVPAWHDPPRSKAADA
jgi:thiamine transport system ATP-binding protein